MSSAGEERRERLGSTDNDGRLKRPREDVNADAETKMAQEVKLITRSLEKILKELSEIRKENAKTNRKLDKITRENVEIKKDVEKMEENIALKEEERKKEEQKLNGRIGNLERYLERKEHSERKNHVVITNLEKEKKIDEKNVKEFLKNEVSVKVTVLEAYSLQNWKQGIGKSVSENDVASKTDGYEE